MLLLTRVPDVIFDSAAQVEVIDLEPEDLLTVSGGEKFTVKSRRRRP